MKKLISCLKFFALIVLILLNACSKPPVQPPKQIQLYEHTVKHKGETLSLISKWYTGNVDNWKIIIQYNPKINPNKISIGDKIFIPDSILNTVEPLPKNFLKKVTPSTTTTTSNSSLPAKNQEKLKSQDESSKDDLDKNTDTGKTDSESNLDPAEQELFFDEFASKETLVLEPTPAVDKDFLNDPVFEETPKKIPPTLTPQEKAKEDLIDELLRS